MHSFGKRLSAKINVMGMQVSILRRSFATFELKGNNSGLHECFYLILPQIQLPLVFSIYCWYCRLIGAWCFHNFWKYMHYAFDTGKYFYKNNNVSAINKWENEQNIFMLLANFGKSIEHLLSESSNFFHSWIPSYMSTLVYIFRLPISLRIGGRGI